MSSVEKITPLARRPIAAERVADQLKELIRSGNLKAGDLLPSENELANALHVSRPVVREALRGLQILGLIATRQGGRCSVTDLDVSRLMQPFEFVMGLSESNVDKLYEARVVIEGGLIRIGAPRVTDAALADLTGMVEAGFALASDPVGFRVLDLEFHQRIMRLADNPFLEAAAKGLYALGMEYRRVASQTPGVIERSAAEHAGIVAALATRDPGRAAEAMRVHLTSINRTTVDAMRRLGERPAT
jgi:GntR family transcriptional regulator, transcriptional repressor for pyruvate dehydrogenase complex